MELKVGIVRDDRYMLHQTGLAHPERPARLKAIYRMVDKEFTERLISIEPDLATLEQLELVHTPAYIKKLLKTAEREFTILAPDTPTGPQSHVAAWLAVGGCIKGFHALLSGRYDACFSLVRPPGHHAQRGHAGGFCIFNNLGITARYAIERHGFRRILVIDWDIHHGDGIQDLFYETSEVLYISSHYKGWYPYSGGWEEAGKGDGLGYTVNVPVPKDLDDAELIYIYWKLLGSIMKQYKPELILVAAGFDAHWRDPIGRTQVTENAFRHLTEMIIEFRDAVRSPPILFALEGGYDASAVASCVREVLDVLTVKGPRNRVPVSVAPRGIELIEKAISVHRKYRVWTD
jgi:acetoin utilization deacetylase AcuC-like enzyme